MARGAEPDVEVPAIRAQWSLYFLRTKFAMVRAVAGQGLRNAPVAARFKRPSLTEFYWGGEGGESKSGFECEARV